MNAALAAPPLDEPVAPAAAPKSAPPALAGFELLASAGYGLSMAEVGEYEFEPYALSFGLDVGYTFAVGFRLGGYFGYGLGRTTQAS